MGKFLQADYIRLFQLACELYDRGSGPARLREKEIAVELMNMCERALGRLHRPDRPPGGEL